MKIKDGYIVREVAGTTVVLPTGDDLDLTKMIKLNDTGKFLWQQLQQEIDEDGLVSALLREYSVDEETARAGVQRFVNKLKDNGLLI